MIVVCEVVVLTGDMKFRRTRLWGWMLMSNDAVEEGCKAEVWHGSSECLAVIIGEKSWFPGFPKAF